MPIGKDSIQKRVAKVEPAQDNVAPELVATTAAAPAKASAPKKTTTTKSTTTKTTATKSTTTKSTTTAKKPAAKKPAAPKAEVKVETAVLTNVAPETVEKVIGHKEDEKYEKVQIGQKMPDFLL